MASIKKRKSTFSVIYWYLDNAGERKQKWDTFETKKEAKQRKAFVEYYGKQVEEKDIIARVKKAWTRSGKKVGDIKEMDLYIKPEENAVYYVINRTETGAVEFKKEDKKKQ